MTTPPSILQANRKGRSPDSSVIAITSLISGLHVLSICTVLSPHYKRFLGDIALDRRRCFSGRRCSRSMFHSIQLQIREAVLFRGMHCKSMLSQLLTSECKCVEGGFAMLKAAIHCTEAVDPNHGMDVVAS